MFDCFVEFCILAFFVCFMAFGIIDLGITSSFFRLSIFFAYLGVSLFVGKMLGR